VLQVSHLRLSYPPRTVLDDVSFTVAPGEKAGLIGSNGAGKSSLLKVIAGLQPADGGSVIRPRTYGYLSQDLAQELADQAAADAATTVRDFIFSSTGLDQALVRFHDLSRRVAAASGSELPSLLQELSVAQERLEQLGYYEAEARCEALLDGVKLDGVTLDRPATTLSGGQKIKLALVRLLFQAPELLLLDEPDNFLDAEAAVWLMEFLERYRGALILISHDLQLLRRSITKILRLNEFTHKVEEYRGTYTDYVNQTRADLTALERVRHQQDREIVRLRRTSATLRRYGATRVRQRVNIDRRIAALEASRPELPPASHRIKVTFPLRQTSGRLVLLAEGLSYAYGERQLFRDLSFQLERGQRLVIVGRNGAGKSTLLRVLIGLTPPRNGDVLLGERVQIGYYAQEHENLDYRRTVLEEARAVLPQDLRRVRAVLGGFLFSGERVTQPVGTLSGGERTRLTLAKIVLQGPNLLVLDEPTTHLDPTSRAILGEALSGYTGTVIAVTHDLELVHQLQPDSLLMMPEGRMVHYDRAHERLVAQV
jgi:ATP-binding cassette subfamily F protein 3